MYIYNEFIICVFIGSFYVELDKDISDIVRSLR